MKRLYDRMAQILSRGQVLKLRERVLCIYTSHGGEVTDASTQMKRLVRCIHCQVLQHVGLLRTLRNNCRVTVSGYTDTQKEECSVDKLEMNFYSAARTLPYVVGKSCGELNARIPVSQLPTLFLLKV